jgi:hypothetical protein
MAIIGPTTDRRRQENGIASYHREWCTGHRPADDEADGECGRKQAYAPPKRRGLGVVLRGHDVSPDQRSHAQRRRVAINLSYMIGEVDRRARASRTSSPRWIVIRSK